MSVARFPRRVAGFAAALAFAAAAHAQQHGHGYPRDAPPPGPAAVADDGRPASAGAEATRREHGHHAGTAHAGAEPPGTQHAETKHAEMKHTEAKHAEAKHAETDHAGMDHSRMDHSRMDPPTGEGEAPREPRTPIPPITDADRAAAQPPAHGHRHGDGVFSYLLFDRLEAWDAGPGIGQAWEAQGWIGTDRHRLHLRSEGERERGRTAGADIEVLYGRPLARWWDLVAGVRHDIAPGDGRDFAAIGVIGVAPQKFELEATAYIGTAGQTAARVEAEYELLLTNRLILQPVVEAQWHGRRDASRGVGAGLGTVEAGLRLRYEFTRRFAPYLGLVHERSFGRTAGYRREDDEATRDTRVVAGLRFWF